MISMLIYSCKQDEIELLQSVAKDIIANISDERLNTVIRKELSEDGDVGVIHLALVDITGKEGVAAAKRLRSQYPELEILIIADPTISPVEYLTPDIRGASLILKPFVKKDVRSTLEGYIRLVVGETTEKDYFIVENKGECIRVPYCKIEYFEARNKRVYIRAGGQEYGTYKVLEALAKDIPDFFRRCHRSYIVNRKVIKKIRYSDNMIVLENDIMIPLSRKYKQEFKGGMLNG